VASNEEQFTIALNNGDLKVFEEVYTLYFKPLHVYAGIIVKDETEAEEIVQNVFMKIWEKKERIEIQTSLKAYLYKAVYFDSLNLLKHQKVKSSYQTHSTYVMKNSKAASATDQLLHRNLEDRLRTALNELPEQCRTVFQLSRFEDLKYREIAGRLQISEKTVENHMGKALKILRLKLADFVTVMVLVMIHLKNMLH